MKSFAACALSVAGFLSGQDLASSMGRPVLGYVAESSPAELRAILGVPGSAVFSDPLLLPRGVSRINLAPGQAFALVEVRAEVRIEGRVEGSGGDLSVIPLRAGATGDATPIPGALRGANLIRFSPTGQSVLLYSSGAGRLQVISGLPGAPSVTRNVDASSFPVEIEDAAISDDASTILLTTAGAIHQLTPSDQMRQISSTTGSARVAFLPNSSRAAIADRDAGVVYLWSGESPMLLATGLIGLGEMRASSDGLSLWFNHPDSNSVSRIDTKTGQLRATQLQVSPSRLDLLSSRDAFLISADPGQPAWVFFQQGSEGLAVFVPAAKPGWMIRSGSKGGSDR